LKFKTLNDSLIVKPIEIEDTKAKEVKTQAGIVIPAIAIQKDRDYEAHVKGEVLSSGNGIISGGKIFPNECKVGDIIYYRDGGYKKIMLENELYHILTEKNVMAVEINAKD
jgi:co-chaperonin GroES (HSP10)